MSVGFLAISAALAVIGCSTNDTGETLTVIAVPDSPSEVPGSTVITAIPVINYRGAKDLKYNWTVHLPLGGEVLVDKANTENAEFTFNQLGTYTVKLLVYEDGGSISKTSSGQYAVTSFPALSIIPTVPAITYPTGGVGSGTITLAISGGKAPYDITWVPPAGAAFSAAGSSATITVSGGAIGVPQQFVVTATVTDSLIPASSRTVTMTVVATVTSAG